MSTRHRSPCQRCWDPVDQVGAETCCWCSMSLAERRRAGRLHALAAAAVLGTLLIAALLA